MPRRGRTPTVPPETIYEPLTPFIEDARERGLSDSQIYERIERAKRLAHKAGYSGGEIARALMSESVEPESGTKGFLRGVAKGLSLGFYEPESLKKRPSEIPRGIPIGVGEVYPEGLGEVAGGLATSAGAVGALRAGRLTSRGLAKLRARLNEDPVFASRFESMVAGLLAAGALGSAFFLKSPTIEWTDRGRR